MENAVLDDRHHWLVDKLVESFKLDDRALAENFVKETATYDAISVFFESSGPPKLIFLYQVRVCDANA